MAYGGRQVEDFLYVLHQCKHCGDWLNNKGYVDLGRTPKLKTSKGVYCVNCKTALKRKEMDEANAKLFKKKK